MSSRNLWFREVKKEKRQGKIKKRDRQDRLEKRKKTRLRSCLEGKKSCAFFPLPFALLSYREKGFFSL
jgi:hypothetical protein